MMVSDDRQVLLDQPVQQSPPCPNAKIAVGVVDTLGLGKRVGQRVVERDVSGQAPIAIEQIRVVPRGVAGRGERMYAGEELLAVADQANTIAQR